MRLPAKAPDFFSYQSKKEISKGAIVKIEFKKRKVFGYVFNSEPIFRKRWFIKKSKIELKPILQVVNLQSIISDNQVKLAFWLKNYANLSLASSLSLFFPYLNKIIEINKKLERPYSHKKTSLKKGEKILVLVPNENYLSTVTKEIETKFKSQPLVIKSSLSSKNFENLLKKIIIPEKNIFISNKNGIFLPWIGLDKIIVYDEGSFFYKDFFKPPYFDYRKIFLKFSEINKIPYIPWGNIPSFYSINNFNLSKEKKITFQKISTLEDFEKRINNFNKTIIFVPQKTVTKVICQNCFSLLRCQNCDQFLSLSSEETVDQFNFYCPYCLKNYKNINTCDNCHNKLEIFNLTYSANNVYKYLLNLGRNVIFLDKESKKLIKLFNDSEKIDMVGSLLTLNPEIKSTDAFFFFNFDQFYHTFNLFLRERFIRILDFFYQKTKNVFLFSKIKNEFIEEKISEGKIIDYLLEERKNNKLPPFKRLIILKYGSQDILKLQEKLIKTKNFLLTKQNSQSEKLEIIGPVFSYPPKKRKKFFLQLILKINEDLNFNLKKFLEDIEIEEIEIDAEQL